MTPGTARRTAPAAFVRRADADELCRIFQDDVMGIPYDNEGGAELPAGTHSRIL